MRLGFFAYPWDLLDETPKLAITAMVERCFANAVYLNSNYHHARLLRPRARGRKTVQLPGAIAAYWPETARYKEAGIMPVAEPSLADSQVLARSRELCSVSGVDFGLWSVGLHNSSLGEQQPEYCMRNCFGDRYTYSLCPSNRAVRAYMRALLSDLSAQFQPDRILIEAIGFLGFWAVLTAAGLVQGAAKVYEIPYIQSVVATHPYMVGRVIFGSLIIFAQPIFLYNMYMTARYGKKKAPEPTPSATAAAVA